LGFRNIYNNHNNQWFSDSETFVNPEQAVLYFRHILKTGAGGSQVPKHLNWRFSGSETL
jgi:hypothetical protein